MVDGLIDPRHQPAAPKPEGAPHRRTHDRDDEDHLEVMQGNLEIRIAKRLDQADLLTLGLHETGDHDVKQEGSNPKKDRRHDNGCRREPGNFLRDETI